MNIRRDANLQHPVNREKIGLPPRLFMFTLDQVAYMLNVTLATMKAQYVYFEGRSTGRRRLDLLSAVNIAPDDVAPEWRIPERELVRWAKSKRIKFHEWGTFS